ncbi:unnamed protein product [Angiostrongylus costaricensis]|uniref:CUB domain-containing protein n=1 Tax=Angiostrongylus costaricensis TaxID=334426 RepID=A0A158PM59_ANGCS|nr:unnamed protein product [Angiostrongylus costaricensis]
MNVEMQRRTGTSNACRLYNDSAYSRSDLQVVHAKLNIMRKRWMAKLKKDDIAQPLYRFPVKEIQKNLPPENMKTIRAITDINRNANLSEYMYQADIILTLAQIEQIIENDENQERVRRQAYRDRFYPNTIWDKTFYYYFAPTATDTVKTVLKAAAQYWQQNTCIKFVESTTAPNRVRVLKGDGCYSYVGRVGGVQDLSLGKGCESPSGCGDILIAGPSYSLMISHVGDGTRQAKMDFKRCNYWIKAPQGKRVQVRLENYEGFGADGCIYGGVEIKAHPDQLRTGYR